MYFENGQLDTKAWDVETWKTHPELYQYTIFIRLIEPICIYDGVWEEWAPLLLW